MELEISSDSSDTIILSSNNDNNEPTTSGSVDSKVSNSSFNKFYDLDDFSDEDLVDEPLIKRIKNSDKNIQCIGQDSVIEDMKFNDDVFKIHQKPDDISIKLKMLRSKYYLDNESSVTQVNVAVVSDSSDSEPNNEGLSEKKCHRR
ncbi:hypothetical protein NQ317_015161 [Molorchus minor]|uniref:Uncharacterized protein n=1 Tax=Molorchus minor TaxID=1323400 RepID=A0ABQ9K690_9CUCU|nr:hypothetical protein NQ317_015161 [Molorchus minor]